MLTEDEVADIVCRRFKGYVLEYRAAGRRHGWDVILNRPSENHRLYIEAKGDNYKDAKEGRQSSRQDHAWKSGRGSIVTKMKSERAYYALAFPAEGEEYIRDKLGEMPISWRRLRAHPKNLSIYLAHKSGKVELLYLTKKGEIRVRTV